MNIFFPYLKVANAIVEWKPVELERALELYDVLSLVSQREAVLGLWDDHQGLGRGQGLQLGEADEVADAEVGTPELLTDAAVENLEN